MDETEVTSATIVKGRNRWVFGGIVGFIILFIGLVVVFGNPSAESVFKDMNQKMLQTKSIVVDQEYVLESTSGSSGTMSLKLYMDFESNDNLKASGDFSMDMTSDGAPMVVKGDLIKIGDDSYVKFNKISLSGSDDSASYALIEKKVKGEWIKVRDKDSVASLANNVLDYTSTIFPIPFANLDVKQQTDMLSILSDKNTYTIEESSNVDVSGVAAYKYEIKYDDSKYNEFAKKLSEYVSYFEYKDDNEKSNVDSMTVWINISTKKLIKIEFTGSTKDGDKMTGAMSFSDYDKKQTVEKPSDYSIESELIE